VYDYAVACIFTHDRDMGVQKRYRQGQILGLSACQGIVQAHRGRIWFEQGKQGGTAVNVELPVASSPLQGAMGTAPLLA
jgi:K+-sensing histidine kinase KdpD